MGDACDPDDDDDELLDLYETGAGVFVSPTNAGSDPFDPDTDDDGFGDGAEVSAGFDPNEAGSYPTGPAVPAMGLAGRLAAGLLVLAAGAAALLRRGRPGRGPI